MTGLEATDPVYLYILMRTDLESMNPGKAVAQGAHAANQCVHKILQNHGENGADAKVLLLMEWQNQTNEGFGTTITLGVNEASMRAVVDTAVRMGEHAGIVHDPSYPLRDGSVTHLLALDTCGFIFARKKDVEYILRQFNLMP